MSYVYESIPYLQIDNLDELGKQSNLCHIQYAETKCKYENIQCPFCRVVNRPTALPPFYMADKGNHGYLLHMCSSCNKLFLSVFVKSDFGGYSYAGSYPYAKFQSDYPPAIDKISNRFKDVYEQAMQSEIYQLTELVGMGLRKATEILVTDYLLNVVRPDKVEAKFYDRIKQLGIPNAQTLATVCRLVGNDETHTSVSSSFNIDDMKTCLSLLINALNESYVSLQYEEKLKSK